MFFSSFISYELSIALRYTKTSKRRVKNGFISFISLISISGISLGVAALIVVLSVMNGFQKEVRDRMLSVVSHIEIFSFSGALKNWDELSTIIKKNKNVVASAPYIDSQVLVTNGENLQGIFLKGILPKQENNVSNISNQVIQGNLNYLVANKFNIILGSELAYNLKIQVGDKINLIAPKGQISLAGVIPRLKRFNVVGVFNSGHYEYDSSLAFVHLSDSKKLFQLDGPIGLRVKLNDIHKAVSVSKVLSKELNNKYFVRDWSKLNKNWFEAVQIEKKMMFLILTLIIAVAAFNLVSSLVMTVTEKQSDIAILRTLGVPSYSIMMIFIYQGLLVGFFGTVIGLTLGIVLSLNLDIIFPFFERLFSFQFLPKEIYLISILPTDLRLKDLLQISLISVLLAFFSTIYPSFKASKIQPADALKRE